MTVLILIRPEPGASASIAAARERGINAMAMPVFRIEPVEWVPPQIDGFDGLLIGSANAVRHGGAALANYRHLPVYAVGATTAQVARNSGFTIAAVGAGGLQNLIADMAGSSLRLLRLSGEERIALTPPDGIALEERTVYRAIALPIDTAFEAQLRDGCAVALHSAAAASHLRTECERLRIDRSSITILSLGPRIAQVAGDGWQASHTAAEPTDASLMELAASLYTT